MEVANESVTFVADINVTGSILTRLLPQTRLKAQSQFNTLSGAREGRLDTYRGKAIESVFSKTVSWAERDAISVVELVWFCETLLAKAPPNTKSEFFYFDGQHLKKGELTVDGSSPSDSFSRAGRLQLDKLTCELVLARKMISEIVLQAPVVGPVKLELEH